MQPSSTASSEIQLYSAVQQYRYTFIVTYGTAYTYRYFGHRGTAVRYSWWSAPGPAARAGWRGGPEFNLDPLNLKFSR
eukprot:SAG31_NODE_131_length_23419_cov_38.760087_14_plen_78_part_00